MAEVIRMPLLSDTMKEGVIADWHKKVGDTVKSDDVIAEVETDKATMEVVGYVEGTLLYIGTEKGKAAKVNDIIAIVGKPGEDFKPLLEGTGTPAPSAAPAPAAEATPAPAPAAPAPASNAAAQEALKNATVIRMPLLSDTMKEGKIASWLKKVGDTVKSDDVLAEVETDKATMEVVGYAEGTLLYIGVKDGEAIPVNAIMAIVGKPGTNVDAILSAEGAPAAPAASAASAATPAATAPAAAANTAAPAPVAVSTTSNGRVKASPLAKKLAEEKGIDISQVPGSGDAGRIVKRDIDSFVPATKTAAPAAATTGKPAVAAAPAGQESFTDIPVTTMRKVIAKRLSESKFQAPHFYLKIDVNMDKAIEARKAINEVSPVKISFNDMVIKAAALALRQHPDVNSSWMGDFIRQNHHISIGSAVALPEGLIVPVIKFVDFKTLSQIAADAKELYDKAKNKKLQPNDFTGNTFTVSNLGMLGIDEFTAIINPPDSAILAVGNIKETVVSEKGQFKAVNIMKLTLSCDHRSVDGAVGARFLATLKGFLESPVTMLV
ncbi:pyruvate dehydrogenase E2 component (dihydrolipoamide acetyltransferase) [Chitinophaga costaii]|uniref:Acetyltransferase component of pyruvate dehydrogenase complex n=1 Tax=Chitinophaga costaii TaxID=1335309 RepID=A0A1C4BN42_9BACT|nr:pyruvate dehydrogenase complex dihydrolipoamide acetyltransferase [Chitinophaga costaii]PUZ27540.1 pyruvate dehydrogenase complex dihydrolipoamide acetyltransferase [Chitinophaga costaii]SCC08316.1 pyruvate dehydrogenase E2 component (dihydrolipoamide acetyltransferase) [Chitinophaga costaii]